RLVTRYGIGHPPDVERVMSMGVPVGLQTIHTAYESHLAVNHKGFLMMAPEKIQSAPGGLVPARLKASRALINPGDRSLAWIADGPRDAGNGIQEEDSNIQAGRGAHS